MTLDDRHNRGWQLKKDKLRRDVEKYSGPGSNLVLLGTEDLGDELRIMSLFKTQTLVRPPGGEAQLRGPVIAGIRYCRGWMSLAPIPWEIVTIFEPFDLFHPSVNPAGGLCLGHPMPNSSMELILNMTWAALVLNTRVVNTVEWQIFNPAAAAHVRHAAPGRFPLTHRGLLEGDET